VLPDVIGGGGGGVARVKGGGGRERAPGGIKDDQGGHRHRQAHVLQAPHSPAATQPPP